MSGPSGAELVAGILGRRFELCVWRREHRPGHCPACGLPSPGAGCIVLRGGPADGLELQVQDPPPPFVVLLDPAAEAMPVWIEQDGPPAMIARRQLLYRSTYLFSTISRRRVYEFAG